MLEFNRISMMKIAFTKARAFFPDALNQIQNINFYGKSCDSAFES